MNTQQNEPPKLPVAAVLLDQVHAAILRSDYAALGGLSDRLERELQEPSDVITDAGLRQIHKRAHRNAAILLAAQRGIRSARRRLSEIKETAAGLVTYDRGGRRAEVNEGRNLAQRL